MEIEVGYIWVSPLLKLPQEWGCVGILNLMYSLADDAFWALLEEIVINLFLILANAQAD